jgi:ABC-type multidrug transport system ATPase subunit
MGTDAVIQLQGLTIRYGSFTAVDGLDLTICRGELFGLLGPNGAGKSSTLRVLIGQRKPTSGSASILGLDVIRDWHAIKPRFGYVPDRENHFEEFTGRGNLKFYAGLYGVNEHRIDECLKLVELDEAGHVRVRGYSLGMRRKLLLARALLHQPDLLYLDEPTANLDVHSAEVVRRILRNLAAQGRTVVITTHDMDEVQAICSRVAILSRGRLVALDTPISLRQQHHERKADVELNDGTKLVIDLDCDAQRAELAKHVAGGAVASVRTREFDFHAAFLKLTGTAFD